MKEDAWSISQIETSLTTRCAFKLQTSHLLSHADPGTQESHQKTVHPKQTKYYKVSSTKQAVENRG